MNEQQVQFARQLDRFLDFLGYARSPEKRVAAGIYATALDKQAFDVANQGRIRRALTNQNETHW